MLNSPGTSTLDQRSSDPAAVAVWPDGAIHFQTGAEEQKAANLRVNRHVALRTGSNHWDEGSMWWSKATP